MNKKIITALLAITLTIPTTAHAAFRSSTVPTPTLAVLDTALDSSVPAFSGRIIHEVCLLEWNTCPNGKSFMEGPGSALTYPASFTSGNTFKHGTQMVSAALQSNPNMNVLFIRIIGNTINGDRQIANERTVVNALNWVAANASKYNIQAVSMSQGHHMLGSSADYCPNTPNTVNAIKSLILLGIPSFFAVGNNRDYKRIDWPSCINESIAVGGVDQNGEITNYSNADSAKLDFYALGSMRVNVPGGGLVNASGTSIAAQVAAANWIQVKSSKLNLTYTQILDLITNTAKTTKGASVPSGKLIDIASAISGDIQQIKPVDNSRAILEAEVKKAIADAEAQYAAEVKAAQDKLNATKAVWMAKLNG